MTDAGWIAGALVLGFAIGALVVWLINRKAAGPSHSVKALREESERFREEVNDHFVETAELINQLTDSYKKVFDHLSEGAERLVDEKVIRERMPEVSDQEIRLKRIGQTSTRSDSTEKPEAPEQTGDKDEEPEPAAPESESAAASEAKPAADQATGSSSTDEDGGAKEAGAEEKDASKTVHSHESGESTDEQSGPRLASVEDGDKAAGADSDNKNDGSQAPTEAASEAQDTQASGDKQESEDAGKAPDAEKLDDEKSDEQANQRR